MWATKDGWPVGVTHAFVWKDGKIWLTFSEHRHRAAAIKRDPRASVNASSAGYPQNAPDGLPTGAITFKGRGEFFTDDATKEWFYRALSKKLNPTSKEGEEFFYNLLDSPLRTILAVTPEKMIMYNGGLAGRHMAVTVYEDELGDNVSAFWSLRPLFIQNILSSDAGNYWCDDKRTSVVETCRGLLESSLMTALHELELREGTDDVNEWRWGDKHRARFNHPLFNAMPVLGSIANLWIETDGGEYTVNRGGMRISDDVNPFSHVHGSGFRGVYNLADLDRSRFIIATGQSGNILSPHYRNLMWQWRDGGFVVLSKTREALAREARLRITLTPR